MILSTKATHIVNDMLQGEIAATETYQQALAKYYKDKAHSLTTKSEEFARQAEILAKQPATIESKQGISCNCPSHFRYFAKIYAQEAADAQAEGERHERLAREYSAQKAAQDNQ